MRGPQDGYTLLATPSAIAVNPSVYSKVPYNLDKDLTPIALVNRNAMIVLVSPKSGINSLADLVARAKEKPGAMNYAIAGNGTLDHLVCEHLRASAGLDMVRINYGGVPKGITALMAGEVQMMVASVVSASSYVRSGPAQGDRGDVGAAPADRARRADHDRARLQEFRDVRLGHAVRAERRARRHRREAARGDQEGRGAARRDQDHHRDRERGAVAQPRRARAYLRQELALFAGIAKASGTRID